MEASNTRRYRAFVSYSHRDETICGRLYKKLDGYQTPSDYQGRPGTFGPVPKRLYPVFRDRDELATSNDLPRRIVEALNESDTLVVLCSPAAVSSRWVNEEIRHFAELNGPQRIHPVIVGGEPPDCFPPGLRELVEEPLAADLREHGDGFADGSLKLVAGILGVPFGALKDREAARAKRRARINTALAATFAVLAIIAGAAAYKANSELARAKRAIEVAVEGVTGVQEEIAEHETSSKINSDVAGSLLHTTSNMIAKVEKEAPDNAEIRFELVRNQIMLTRHFRDSGDLSSSLATARKALESSVRLARFAEYDEDGLRNQANALNEIGDNLTRMGELKSATTRFEEALAITRQLLERYPRDPHRIRDLHVALDKLGDAYRRSGNADGALAAYEESLDQSRIIAEHQPDDGDAKRNVSLGLGKLADLHWDAGNDDAALGLYEEALDLARRLSRSDPAYAQWQWDMSALLNSIGNVELGRLAAADAAASFEEAVAIRRALVQRDSHNIGWWRDLALSLSKLGDALYRSGDRAAAQEHYDETLAMRRQLVNLDSTNMSWLADLSASLDRIADLKRDAGEAEQAMQIYEESLSVAKRLQADDPDDVDFIRGVVIGHDRVADMQEPAGRLDDALVHRVEAVKLVRQLLDKHAGNAIWQADLANALISLGDLMALRDELPLAVQAYDESLVISRRLLEAAPDDAARMHNLSISLGRLATITERAGDLQQALAFHQEGLSLSRELVRRLPDDFEQQRNLAIDLKRVAGVLQTQGDQTAAANLYRERLDVVNTLAKADPAYEPNLTIGYHELLTLYLQLDDTTAAREMHWKRIEAVGARPDDPAWQDTHLAWLSELREFERQLGDVDGAIRAQQDKVVLTRALMQQDDGRRVALTIALGQLAELQLAQDDRSAAASTLSDKLIETRLLAQGGDPKWRWEVALILAWLHELRPENPPKRLVEAVGLIEELMTAGQLSTEQQAIYGRLEERLAGLQRDTDG